MRNLIIILTACLALSIASARPYMHVQRQTLVFPMVGWDAFSRGENVTGYILYMGYEPNHPRAAFNCSNNLEQKVMVNRETLYFSYAAYNNGGVGPRSDELRYDFP